LLVVVVRDLVLRRQLRRHAPGDASDVSIVDARTCGIGHIAERITRTVVEGTGNGLVHSPVPVRRVEPDAFLHDRAAYARVEVPDLVNLADVAQLVVRIEREVAKELVPRARLRDVADKAGRIAVVGRPRLRRPVAEHDTVEGV